MERRPVERVRGTQDSWALEAQQLAAVRDRLEGTFASFGYSRIDVSVLEPAELHLRKSGLEIVSKLYSFEDQGGRRLCLRPELTASVVRAVVAQPPARLPVRLFSSGQVFRYERPARGRYRQFTQSGVELIGADGAMADAEVLFLAMHALDMLGLREYQVTVGHVGILGVLLAKLGITGRIRAFLVESLEEAQRRGIEAVRRRLAALDPELFEEPDSGGGEVDLADETVTRAAVAGILAELGSETLGRRNASDIVERMVRKLRRGDARDTVERALEFMRRLGEIRGQPETALASGRRLLQEYSLAEEPLDDLRRTVELLSDFGARMDIVRVDLGLGRGLQYYTGTVFEIDHAQLGGESQLCGGGRYDDLVRALGGRQPLPALGFAFGVERVRLALEAEGQSVPLAASPAVFMVAASVAQARHAALAAQALREAGLCVQLEVSARPLRTSLAFADKQGFGHVAVVGESEARDGSIRLRNMATGEEQTLPLAQAGALLAGAGNGGAGGGPGQGGPAGRPVEATRDR